MGTATRGLYTHKLGQALYEPVCLTVPDALPGDVGVEARLDVRKVDLLAAGQHVYTSDGHGIDVCRATNLCGAVCRVSQCTVAGKEQGDNSAKRQGSRGREGRIHRRGPGDARPTTTLPLSSHPGPSSRQLRARLSSCARRRRPEDAPVAWVSSPHEFPHSTLHMTSSTRSPDPRIKPADQYLRLRASSTSLVRDQQRRCSPPRRSDPHRILSVAICLEGGRLASRGPESVHCGPRLSADSAEMG